LSRYAPWEPRVAEIAARQDNVITHGQLTALGVGRNAISHRLASARWQRLHKGVYLIGPAPPTLTARARAAVLSCGNGALLSHRTAAEIWQLLPGAARGEIHVTVPGRNPGPRNAVRVHRVLRLAPADVATKLGLPLTSPARTICDLAATTSLRETQAALAEARIHRLATDRQLQAVIERAPTRSGSSVIRSLLEAENESGYTRSRAEREMRELVRAAGLPRPLFNEPLLGYVTDVLWPACRLVVEVDGYRYHRHRGAFERDRRRDQELSAAGYRVIHVTWMQLRDQPIAAITSIAQALART
jgi:very-short-patch-repair endonuclease